MTPHGIPKPGEIYRGPIEFTDTNADKERPVLVISGALHNINNRDVIVLAITSNLAAPVPGLAITADSLEQGELPKASKVLIHECYRFPRNAWANTMAA